MDICTLHTCTHSQKGIFTMLFAIIFSRYVIILLHCTNCSNVIYLAKGKLQWYNVQSSEHIPCGSASWSQNRHAGMQNRHLSSHMPLPKLKLSPWVTFREVRRREAWCLSYGCAPQRLQQMVRGFTLGVGGSVDVPVHISTDTSRISGDGEIATRTLKGSTWLAYWKSLKKVVNFCQKMMILSCEHSNIGELKWCTWDDVDGYGTHDIHL